MEDGEPRGSGDAVVQLLKGIPLRSYRNRAPILLRDPVPDLPPSEPVPFRHGGGNGRPLIDVSVMPTGLGRFRPSAYHHFQLYNAATARLSPMPST